MFGCALFSANFPNADEFPSGKSNRFDCCVFEVVLPNRFVCGVDWSKLPNMLFVGGACVVGNLKNPLCVDGVNLLDPNTDVDVVLDVEDVELSAVATVFGDKRDFGLDFRGTKGILNMPSSSVGVGVGVLFMRASMRASGR